MPFLVETTTGDFRQVFLTITPNSPLEQFAILPLIPMKIGDLYFSFTNPSFFMLLTLSLVLLLVYFVTKKGGGNSVPNAWQSGGGEGEGKPRQSRL